MGAELRKIWQYLRQVSGDDPTSAILRTTGRRMRASRR